jgi:hypothetical protein
MLRLLKQASDKGKQYVSGPLKDKASGFANQLRDSFSKSNSNTTTDLEEKTPIYLTYESDFYGNADLGKVSDFLRNSSRKLTDGVIKRDYYIDIGDDKTKQEVPLGKFLYLFKPYQTVVPGENQKVLLMFEKNQLDESQISSVYFYKQTEAEFEKSMKPPSLFGFGGKRRSRRRNKRRYTKKRSKRH